MVYKVGLEEAKMRTLSGQCVLIDPKTMERFETPQEWLTVVEKKEENVVQSDDTVEIEELRKLYVEKFGKNLSIRYQNDAEWIKGKLYS